MFFKVENGLLVLAKEELRNIAPFKALLERDKGSDGDNDGRKKYRAFKEFYYIWYTTDVRSPGVIAGYTDKELHIKAIKESRLEDTYKPDKLVKEATSYYRAEQEELLVSSNAVINLIKAVRLSDVLTKRMVVSMEKILEEEKEKDDIRQEKINNKETVEPVNLVEEAQRTAALLGQFDQVIKLSEKIPKILPTLEALQKKLKVEESGSETIRGGGKKGSRMDPK